MTIINLLLIQLIIVFIIDLSGVMNSIKIALSKWLTKGKVASTGFNIKPFDCSLCMTFWIGLIYLLITKSFTLPYIAVVAGLSFLTQSANDLLLLIKDLITKVINTIYKII